MVPPGGVEPPFIRPSVTLSAAASGYPYATVTSTSQRHNATVPCTAVARLGTD